MPLSRSLFWAEAQLSNQLSSARGGKRRAGREVRFLEKRADLGEDCDGRCVRGVEHQDPPRLIATCGVCATPRRNLSMDRAFCFPAHKG